MRALREMPGVKPLQTNEAKVGVADIAVADRRIAGRPLSKSSCKIFGSSPDRASLTTFCRDSNG